MPKIYHTIFNFIALTVIIYMGVNVFYTFTRAKLRLADTGPIFVEQKADDGAVEKPSLDAYQSILDRNLFDSADRKAVKETDEDYEALEPTTLKLALFGTVAGDLPNAVAIIEETDKKTQGLYKVGDTVQNAVVKRILREKVVLKVGVKDEILSMLDQLPGAEPAEEGKKPVYSQTEAGIPATTITVALAEMEQAFSDMNKLLSEVRIRPNFLDGKPNGLSLSNIKRDSIFARLGLKSGDIVHSVDQGKVESADDMVGLYQKLRSGAPVSLEIKRRGQDRIINYQFK